MLKAQRIAELDGNLASKDYFNQNLSPANYDHFRLQGTDKISVDSYEIKLKAFLDPNDQWAKSEWGENGQPPEWCKECEVHDQHFDGESKMNFSLTQEVELLVIHSRYLVYEDLILKKGGNGDALTYTLREDKEQEYIC